MLDLLLPRQCPCGQWDTWACDACLEYLDQPLDVTSDIPRLLIPSISGDTRLLDVFASGHYQSPAGQLIRQWKTRPQHHLGDRITQRLATVLQALPLPEGQLKVIPAPSHPARYRRGTFIAGNIAKAVADHGRARGVDAVAWDAFYPRRGRQQGQSRQGRGQRQPVEVTDFPTSTCIIVDDVITTGATMADCYRALRNAGHRVHSGFALCAVSSLLKK